MSIFFAQLRRDLLLAIRDRSEAANPIAFFALAVLLLGLGVGRDVGTLGAGAIWVLALFANVLSAESLFRRDHEDGTLEQLLVYAKPLFPAILGKLTAHWLLAGLPLAVLGPLAFFFLRGSMAGAVPLCGSLLLGMPVLTALSAIGAALTVGTGRGGMLLAILVMPLYVPVLIFGVGAAAAAPSAAFAQLMLAALLVAALTAAPFAVGKALVISQEY